MKVVSFFNLTVRINWLYEVSTDVQDGELSMMSNAACDVLKKARKNIFVKMCRDKL